MTGIASLLLYPEDESGDSTQPEDEDSEAGETDEQDGEAEPPLHEGEALERRAAPPTRPNLAPHSMQWAIRLDTFLIHHTIFRILNPNGTPLI